MEKKGKEIIMRRGLREEVSGGEIYRENEESDKKKLSRMKGMKQVTREEKGK